MPDPHPARTARGTDKHAERHALAHGGRPASPRTDRRTLFARVVEFFVSDLSEYVTGQVLRVDGGMQLFAG